MNKNTKKFRVFIAISNEAEGVEHTATYSQYRTLADGCSSLDFLNILIRSVEDTTDEA